MRLSDSESISALHSIPFVKTDCIEATAARHEHQTIHVPMLELSQQLFNERCKEKIDVLWGSSDAHQTMFGTIIEALKDIAENGRSASLDALVEMSRRLE